MSVYLVVVMWTQTDLGELCPREEGPHSFDYFIITWLFLLTADLEVTF